jgi:hypothetical protein
MGEGDVRASRIILGRGFLLTRVTSRVTFRVTFVRTMGGVRDTRSWHEAPEVPCSLNCSFRKPAICSPALT